MNNKSVMSVRGLEGHVLGLDLGLWLW